MTRLFSLLDDHVIPQRQIPGTDRWLRLVRVAKQLAAITLVWLGIEGVVGVWAGLGAHSMALVGFGLDSAIEALASVIVIWRFTGSRVVSPRAESTAQRVVGVSFYLLAAYIAAEAIKTLLTGTVINTSWIGIALTFGAMMICPWLGRAKRRIAGQLGSGTVGGEGTQNLLCAALAGGVLVGLVANTALGLWWFDPVIALVIATICVREGGRAWRGDQCGCTSCDITPPVIEDCRDCESTNIT